VPNPIGRGAPWFSLSPLVFEYLAQIDAPVMSLSSALMNSLLYCDSLYCDIDSACTGYDVIASSYLDVMIEATTLKGRSAMLSGKPTIFNLNLDMQSREIAILTLMRGERLRLDSVYRPTHSPPICGHEFSPWSSGGLALTSLQRWRKG